MTTNETEQLSTKRILSARFPYTDWCPKCAEMHRMGDTFAPSHNGSTRCKSGSIASGGRYSHCTCDACF